MVILLDNDEFCCFVCHIFVVCLYFYVMLDFPQWRCTSLCRHTKQEQTHTKFNKVGEHTKIKSSDALLQNNDSVQIILEENISLTCNSLNKKNA